ncbi:hypothetical protein FDB34_11570 [Clostridium botulinum]|nr:hypothetical protein [Clostridium botulinum]
MKYYYENNFMIFKLMGRLHKKIVIYNLNYKKHIKVKHPEMNLKKIEKILKEPDYIYKSSCNSEEYYYEKKFNEETYRVVISTYKKHVKCVVTAYKVDKKERFTVKHVRCVYDKDTFIEYEDIQKELENDMDYFYKAFNIEK